ncbi:MAG: trypsin-like serine protease [Candidatus Omnitrophica bacterium]|nr:trypsin-like serine protease [Candidatus Omnitrophota bacterium]
MKQKLLLLKTLYRTHIRKTRIFLLSFMLFFTMFTPQSYALSFNQILGIAACVIAGISATNRLNATSNSDSSSGGWSTPSDNNNPVNNNNWPSGDEHSGGGNSGDNHDTHGGDSSNEPSGDERPQGGNFIPAGIRAAWNFVAEMTALRNSAATQIVVLNNNGVMGGGVVIGTHTVLTAAHVATAHTNPGDENAMYIFGPDYLDNYDNENYINGNVNRVIFAPGSLDLAIIVYEDPLFGAPVTIAEPESIEAGDVVQVTYEDNLVFSSDNTQVTYTNNQAANEYAIDLGFELGLAEWGPYPNSTIEIDKENNPVDIAPGDSGFPAFNESGELIGVVHGEVIERKCVLEVLAGGGMGVTGFGCHSGDFNILINVTQANIHAWIETNKDAVPN